MGSMKKKMKAEFTMTCQQCGAEMSINLVKGGRRFSAHCFGCGLHMFGPVPLLDRLKYVNAVCPHKPELKACKRGLTSWCAVCRVRTFAYECPE